MSQDERDNSSDKIGPRRCAQRCPAKEQSHPNDDPGPEPPKAGLTHTI